MNINYLLFMKNEFITEVGSYHLVQQTKLWSTDCPLQIYNITPIMVPEKKQNSFTFQSHAGLLFGAVISLGVLSKSQSHLQTIRYVLQHTVLQSCMTCERVTQQRCCLTHLAVSCGFSRRSVSRVRDLAPPDSAGCALQIKKIKSLTRATALPVPKVKRVTCFLMFCVALDIHLPPLRILPFFVNVSFIRFSQKCNFVHICRD